MATSANPVDFQTVQNGYVEQVNGEWIDHAGAARDAPTPTQVDIPDALIPPQSQHLAA